MEITDDTLIKKINKTLKETWSKKETATGKSIKVEWAWAPVINRVIKRYRSKGWKVTKYVATDGAERLLYLTFKNSLWVKNKKNKSWPR